MTKYEIIDLKKWQSEFSFASLNCWYGYLYQIFSYIKNSTIFASNLEKIQGLSITKTL